MESPFFSVIVNAYNVGEYIDETLRSLEDQTFHDFEAILVDDGSTDGTTRSLELYERDHERTVFVSEGHNGLLLARRIGLAHARGSYVLFLDGDDRLHPGALARCASEIMKTGVDIVMFKFSREPDFSSVEGPFALPVGIYCGKAFREVRRRVCRNEITSIWNKAYRRSCIDIDVDYRSYAGLTQAEDLFQILPIFGAASSLSFIPDTLYYYRRNPHSLTSRFSPNMLQDLPRVAERLRAYATAWGDECRHAALQGESMLYLYLLEACFQGAAYPDARRAFLLIRDTMVRFGVLARLRKATFPFRIRPVRFCVLHEVPHALGWYYRLIHFFKAPLSWLNRRARLLAPALVDGGAPLGEPAPLTSASSSKSPAGTSSKNGWGKHV